MIKEHRPTGRIQHNKLREDPSSWKFKMTETHVFIINKDKVSGQLILGSNKQRPPTLSDCNLMEIWPYKTQPATYSGKQKHNQDSKHLLPELIELETNNCCKMSNKYLVRMDFTSQKFKGMEIMSSIRLPNLSMLKVQPASGLRNQTERDQLHIN